MKRVLIPIVLMLGLAVMSLQATAECGANNPLLRPLPDGYSVYGASIPASGTWPYQVKVGHLIELDVTINVVPGAPDSYEMKITNNQAIHWASPKKRRINVDMVGSCTMAYFIKATDPGDGQVVLNIGGQEFTYNFQVTK